MIINRREDFNFYLGDTADMIRETVSSFAQNEIAPRAADIELLLRISVSLALLETTSTLEDVSILYPLT